MAMKIFNKKGIAFILIAIVLVSIISIVFFTQTGINRRDKQDAIKIRIRTMDDFLHDFYRDADRAAFISGYRAFIAMEDYLVDPDHSDIPGITNGGFFIDPSNTYIELFMNGTIDGENISIMGNASFRDYQRKVNILSRRIDIEFNASVFNATMEHKDPWSVNVIMDFEILLNDMRGLAMWNFTKEITTNIPIVDLKDPLYTVNTGLPVTVRVYPYDEFINDTDNENDTTYFKEFLDENYFINSTRAPSFVQRFSNNLSPSIYGIESMVNINDLIQKEIDHYNNRSIVDFIYFNGSDGTAHNCSFDGFPTIPAWVKLDNNSLHYPYWELRTEINSSSCS